MKEEKLIVDGKNAIFGRAGSFVAKELLKGKRIELINCDQILFSGDRGNLVEKIRRKRRMGRGSSLKGPKYSREGEKLIKRMIRGMLPWDKAKGKEAFKRLRCYSGPENFKEEDLKNRVVFKHKIPPKYFTTKDLIKELK